METRNPRQHHHPYQGGYLSGGPSSSYPASSSSYSAYSSSAAVVTSNSYMPQSYSPISLHHNTTISNPERAHMNRTATVTPTHHVSPTPMGTQHDSLSKGGAAAAVVVPLVVVLAILASVLLWLRKRKQKRRGQTRQDQEPPSTTAALVPPPPSPTQGVAPPPPSSRPSVRFSASSIKRGLRSLRSSRQSSQRSRASSSRDPPPPFSSARTSTSTNPAQRLPPMSETQGPRNPTLMANTLNQQRDPTYFTGLDTWSQSGGSSTRGESGEYQADGSRLSAGGTTNFDPPPPYSVPRASDPAPPTLLDRSPQPPMRSPFEDPDEDQYGVADGFSPFARGGSVLSEHIPRTATSPTYAETLDERRQEEWDQSAESDPFRSPEDDDVHEDGGGASAQRPHSVAKG